MLGLLSSNYSPYITLKQKEMICLGKRSFYDIKLGIIFITLYYAEDTTYIAISI